MELAALGSTSVLRDADVMRSREKARQARFRGLLVVLVVVGVPVIARTAAGVVRYVQGNYAAAAGDFHWPHPGISSSFAPYVPGCSSWSCWRSCSGGHCSWRDVRPTSCTGRRKLGIAWPTW